MKNIYIYYYWVICTGLQGRAFYILAYCLIINSKDISMNFFYKKNFLFVSVILKQKPETLNNLK